MNFNELLQNPGVGAAPIRVKLGINCCVEQLPAQCQVHARSNLRIHLEVVQKCKVQTLAPSIYLEPPLVRSWPSGHLVAVRIHQPLVPGILCVTKIRNLLVASLACFFFVLMILFLFA